MVKTLPPRQRKKMFEDKTEIQVNFRYERGKREKIKLVAHNRGYTSYAEFIADALDEYLDEVD